MLVVFAREAEVGDYELKASHNGSAADCPGGTEPKGPVSACRVSPLTSSVCYAFISGSLGA